NSAIFSPDGKRLVALLRNSDRGEAIVVWEVATGQNIYTLSNRSFGWHTLVFSPDGRVLAASGNHDNTVSFWEAATGKLVGSFVVPMAPRLKEQNLGASVAFLAFSPDSRVLATSSGGDDKVRLWEVASGKEIGQLNAYKHCGDECRYREGCVLAFSPDGGML